MSTDQLMFLSVKSWLDLQKKQSLIRRSYDDPVGSYSFDQTVDMILKAYNNITSEELKQIPLDESCLRAVFYLSSTLLSICNIFTAIQLYRDLKADVSFKILRFEETPDEERKKELIGIVQSYKRGLEMSNCSTDKIVQVFDEVLENLSPEKIQKMVSSHLHGVGVGVEESKSGVGVEESKSGVSVEESKSEKRKANSDDQLEGSDCLKKKIKVSEYVSGDEGTSAACLNSDEVFLEETNYASEESVIWEILGNVGLPPLMHDRMKKSLDALEDASHNYIVTTMVSVKQMLSDLSQHLNLPAPHHKVEHQPSHKFKLILLILKEMMSCIREHPYAPSFGFTLPKYVESTPISEGKCEISYEPGQYFPEKLSQCDEIELYSRLFVSRSIKGMVRLDRLVEAEFLSFREAYKKRGAPFLDAESHDMHIYLVACVKQMKKDMKKKLQQLAQDGEKPHILYEDSTVQRKLREFECQMVNDLVSDFEFCRKQCTILDQEMVHAFSLLMDEFQLGDEDDQM